MPSFWGWGASTGNRAYSRILFFCHCRLFFSVCPAAAWGKKSKLYIFHSTSIRNGLLHPVSERYSWGLGKGRKQRSGHQARFDFTHPPIGPTRSRVPPTVAAAPDPPPPADICPRDYRAWYGLGQTYEILQLYYYALYYFRKATNLRCGSVAPPFAIDAHGQCRSVLLGP